MRYEVQFISLDEDEKDILISFVVPDKETGIKSLILHRTFFFEEIFGEEEKGVKVSLEGEESEQDYINTLIKIGINNKEIKIVSKFSEYNLDISRIDDTDINDMIKLLKKQNYDSRFTIEIA
ncbi:MAG: hypothetical protein GY820_12125 [Gammaproteobacteria bacterium]|nr:hypothetical protein [Gammaproteobacteria bacterium]